MLILLQLVTDSIVFWAVYLFYSAFMKKRQPGNVTLLAGWAAFLLYYNVILKLLQYETFNNILLNSLQALAVNLLLSCCCFHGRVLLKIALSCLFFLISGGCEILTGLLASILFRYSNREIYNHEGLLYAIVFTTSLLSMLSVLTVRRIFRKKSIIGSRAQLLPIIGITVTFCFGIGRIYERIAYSTLTVDNEMAISLFLLLPFVLFSGIAYLLLYENIIIRQEVEAKMRLSLERDRHHDALVRQYEQNMEEKNKLLHDYKNNILHLAAVMDKPEAARAYCEELAVCYTRQLYSDKFDMNNDVLDIVLSKLKYDCKQAGVKLECLFNYRNFSFVSPVDTSRLFGNLFDNALAAIEKPPHDTLPSPTPAAAESPYIRRGKPYIRVVTSRINQLIYIAVSNSHADTVRIKNGVYLSSRREYTQNGEGLGIMKAIAMRYQGDMGIVHNRHEFTATIWLKSEN